VNADVVAKQVAAMAANGLDALLAISPENFTYVTGFVVPSQPVLRWRHAAALTTRDGKTALLSVDMEATTVRSRADGVEVRVWREFEGDAMQVLADLLRDLGLADARIGIESNYRPFGDMAVLEDLLPRARWSHAEHVFDRLRAIKTPRELDLLRRLSRLTDGALETALRSVRPGDTELDLAGALTAAIYRLGFDGFRFLICATGERSQYPNVGPTGRRLQPGDPVRLEIFGMLAGYHAGVCLTAVVGEASPEAERIWANLMACRDIVFEAIRPGASAAGVYRSYLAKFGELGLAPISFVATASASSSTRSRTWGSTATPRSRPAWCSAWSRWPTSPDASASRTRTWSQSRAGGASSCPTW
jgi:Xaa-Pro aminopeptidase